MDPIYCYFDAPEEAFLRYRHVGSDQSSPGQTNTPLACELALVGEQGVPHKGQVDFFDNQVDAKTGTIRVRGVFANADRALVPGMSANVRIPAGPPEQTLLIPDVAVGLDQNYRFVYVVNVTNVVETRTVETGRSHGALRAVLKGLTPQDRVVVNGLVALHTGAKVEAQEASAADAPPAGEGAGHPSARQ
jgi:RND family efflux transporter MFP subunit